MKQDIKWTENGDIAMGSPATNDEGEILYLSEGEWTTNPEKGSKKMYDVAKVRDTMMWKQNIMSRLKTDNPDWHLHPTIGANLSELIGEPNKKETALWGAGMIQEALTYDGLVDERKITVRPVPMSHDKILFSITIHGKNEWNVPLVFNMEDGTTEVIERD